MVKPMISCIRNTSIHLMINCYGWVFVCIFIGNNSTVVSRTIINEYYLAVINILRYNTVETSS